MIPIEPNIQRTAIRTGRILGHVSVAAAIAAAALMAAGGARADQPTPPPASTNSQVKVKFNRPSTGAPSVRLTGGSRGTGSEAVSLDVLAPDEVGLTTQEQPSLFWFQSRPAAAKFEWTLLEENKVKPLVQVSSEQSSKSGIQRIRLADHGVKLTPGVEYQWVVAIINDPENRSSDTIASGVIKRIEPVSELQRKIAAASPESLPGLYAEAGIWYDALTSLSDRIDADPNNKSLQETRTDLLRQGGLKGPVTSAMASK